MKIAIHKRVGSFSDRWIDYCFKNKISYKIVNCYDSDIVSQLDACDGLMWHWDQNDYKALLFARQLTFALEKKNIKVFPDLNTVLHFDDKVGQKYLLESINAPLVNSYVFYSKKDALKWVNLVTFPKVFKLRGGAGSVNVSLLNSRREALKHINRAFGRGFNPINKWTRLKDKIWDFKRDQNLSAVKGILSSLIRLFIPLELERFSHNEKGYIYIQDFIPNNNFDTRIVVIGEKCFGVRRYCRKGDFRASGSGLKGYDVQFFEKELIEESFHISKALQTQSLALDFIWDDNKPKIVEISYCFAMGNFYDDCLGYWDKDLIWHDKEVNPQKFIIEDFINNLTN